MRPVQIMFLRDCAKYIRGEINEIKLNGKKETIKLFACALKESRSLYTELNGGSREMSKILPILKSKKKATNLLRTSTGFVWPF